MPKLNKKIIIIGLFFFLIIFVILIIFISPKSTNTKTGTDAINRVSTTPTPSIYPEPDQNYLDEISYDNLENNVLPETTPSYEIAPFILTQSNSEKIAQTLGFPETEFNNNDVNPFLSGENKTHHLTISPKSSQIYISNLSEKYISTQIGQFSKSPDMLAVQIQSIISKLKIFDSKLVFAISDVNYFQIAGYNLAPSSESESNVLVIHMNPTIDGKFIYLQNNSFVEAIFDSSDKMIKLAINYPLAKISTQPSRNIISYDSLLSLSPSKFFTLLYNPQNLAEVYSPPEITGIDPNQLSIGYFYKTPSNILEPIIVLESSDGLSTLYRFATPASQ